MEKKHGAKAFFSNQWVYGIVLAFLSKLFDHVLPLIPSVNSGILRGLKGLFTVRLAFPAIPMWAILSASLIVIFILIRRIFFRKYKIRAIDGDIVAGKEHHVAGTDNAEFFTGKKEAMRLIELKKAEKIISPMRYFFRYYHVC
jgi:hypothetical protein